MAQMRNFPLGGDGVIVNLLYYLWSKDDDEKVPSVFVPDTVIFEFSQPKTWYFTARKTGTVKRKNRHNLTPERILEVFLKRRPMGSDIVACYLSTSEEGSTKIEYLDEAGLRTFLLTQNQIPDGILQRFVMPKGTNNSMIRSVWSPKVCLIERRINIRKLHDTQYDMYERAATFEGAEVNSRESTVRGHYLPTKVQLLNEAIVRHVAEVSFHKYKINRMVLNLKIDVKDRIWLLWCSSLRLEGGKDGFGSTQGPVKIDFDVTVPKNVNLRSSDGFRAPRNLRTNFKCPSCVSLVGRETCHDVRYKTVIRQFEQVLMKHLSGSVPFEETKKKDTTTALVVTNGSNTYGMFEKPKMNDTVEEAHEKKVGLGGVTISEIVKRHKQQQRRLHVDEGGDYDDDDEYDDEDFDAVIIPPIIHAAHPKLRTRDYERYRHDPLFLYKTSTVCEDCYLHYTDIALAEIESPLLMPGEETKQRRNLSDSDLRVAHASRARRDRAKTHLETLRKIAREKRQAENARKRGVIPRFRKTPSETLRPLRSESSSNTKKREDGSVTLLPFERGIGFPPELNTFERITPRQVETMQQDLDDLVATARKGSARNSNPLSHMRERMRAVERASQKLPALAGGTSSSSLLAPYRETAHIVLKRDDPKAQYDASRSRLLSKFGKSSKNKNLVSIESSSSSVPESKSARNHKKFLADMLSELTSAMTTSTTQVFGDNDNDDEK